MQAPEDSVGALYHITCVGTVVAFVRPTSLLCLITCAQLDEKTSRSKTLSGRLYLGRDSILLGNVAIKHKVQHCFALYR